MLRNHALLLLQILFLFSSLCEAQQPFIRYTVTIPQPESHSYHIELLTEGWNVDTLTFKLPKWSPGYYQIMDYAKALGNIALKDVRGNTVSFEKVSENTLRVIGAKKKTLILSYEVQTTRKFVATSYVDGEHAYLIPAASFFYIENNLDRPVHVIIKNPPWRDIATGLDPLKGKTNEFTALNFDLLFDCPILMGNLESLQSFKVKGVEHRFIGYKLGSFDKIDFINKLQKISDAAVNVIGDIPFDRYTYIAIGPGRGGIEHLNNTTVSFDGNELKSPEAVNRMMNFLAHEYFHHYNVKRIRPLELGPFDYEKGSRTNLLWLSEGLSVYYEYLIVRRAGLADERTLLENFENNINNVENNPGRQFQSLEQASYNTWKDGPFGTQGDEPGKSISYYEKGPVVGLLLDFAIRHATKNTKSLDDVMKFVYWKYYKREGRGFSDAEFQQACEEIAGTPLTEVFEYVNTTKDLDYTRYLGFAGLKLSETSSNDPKRPRKFSILRIENISPLQQQILSSWQQSK
jgi:predicted metalloprotease with PDZ domain